MPKPAHTTPTSSAKPAPSATPISPLLKAVVVIQGIIIVGLLALFFLI